MILSEYHTHLYALSRGKAQVPVFIKIDVFSRNRVLYCKFIIYNLVICSKFLEVNRKDGDKSFLRSNEFEMEWTHPSQTIDKKDRLLSLDLGNSIVQSKKDLKTQNVGSHYLFHHFKELLAQLETICNTLRYCRQFLHILEVRILDLAG